MFLLDTSTVIFIVKDPNGQVAGRPLRPRRRDVSLSSVIEAELQFGAERVPADARLRSSLRIFLSDMSILPWDSICAQQHARLRAAPEGKGKPMGFADCMIAVHALALDLILVTNDNDFARVPNLKLQDWTKGPLPA